MSITERLDTASTSLTQDIPKTQTGTSSKSLTESNSITWTKHEISLSATPSLSLSDTTSKSRSKSGRSPTYDGMSFALTKGSPSISLTITPTPSLSISSFQSIEPITRPSHTESMTLSQSNVYDAQSIELTHPSWTRSLSLSPSSADATEELSQNANTNTSTFSMSVSDVGVGGQSMDVSRTEATGTREPSITPRPTSTQDVSARDHVTVSLKSRSVTYGVISRSASVEGTNTRWRPHTNTSTQTSSRVVSLDVVSVGAAGTRSDVLLTHGGGADGGSSMTVTGTHYVGVTRSGTGRTVSRDDGHSQTVVPSRTLSSSDMARTPHASVSFSIKPTATESMTDTGTPSEMTKTMIPRAVVRSALASKLEGAAVVSSKVSEVTQGAAAALIPLPAIMSEQSHSALSNEMECSRNKSLPLKSSLLSVWALQPVKGVNPSVGTVIGHTVIFIGYYGLHYGIVVICKSRGIHPGLLLWPSFTMTVATVLSYGVSVHSWRALLNGRGVEMIVGLTGVIFVVVCVPYRVWTQSAKFVAEGEYRRYPSRWRMDVWFHDGAWGPEEWLSSYDEFGGHIRPMLTRTFQLTAVLPYVFTAINGLLLSIDVGETYCYAHTCGVCIAYVLYGMFHVAYRPFRCPMLTASVASQFILTGVKSLLRVSHRAEEADAVDIARSTLSTVFSILLFIFGIAETQWQYKKLFPAQEDNTPMDVESSSDDDCDDEESGGKFKGLYADPHDPGGIVEEMMSFSSQHGEHFLQIPLLEEHIPHDDDSDEEEDEAGGDEATHVRFPMDNWKYDL